ncbi:hypothetical protein FQA39_LY14134 [Lamprigera yunnana]|nr:hypothetical protein FQA39_LY14134 [Lamprigera yunnana]
MDVAARNRLLECSDCHSLYHQECHRPPVSNDDADGVWTCHTCKLQKSTNAPPQVTSVIAPVAGTTVLANKAVAKHSSSSLPPPPVQKSAVSTGKVHFNTAKQNSKPPAPNSKSSVSAHITIDKRLQIMKKKAAKLHEKRKQLPR